MQVGDVVKFNDKGTRYDLRDIGTIVRKDIYRSGLEVGGEPLVEVLWSNGDLGWILETRVGVVIT
jgi:hypothetical protein